MRAAPSRFDWIISGATRGIEGLILVLLIVIAFLGIAGLVADVATSIGHHPYLDLEALLHAVDHVLAIFILVELISIAIAYQRQQRVLRKVLEAAFVAVARKIIAFEPSQAALPKGAVLALLLSSLAATWYVFHLIQKSEERR